ncbi:hypothetical protein EVAR_55007_1 [Eumeta japonica]|uniref:Uncharacterized protein n=1 Tax=Eumeta variegata TaxID=151549 RepID=A0A4C1YA58_EUMVA|nr:hypothetical protein EVAR_55007_1 [Eumeta japonica]
MIDRHAGHKLAGDDNGLVELIALILRRSGKFGAPSTAREPREARPRDGDRAGAPAAAASGKRIGQLEIPAFHISCYSRKRLCRPLSRRRAPLRAGDRSAADLKCIARSPSFDFLLTLILHEFTQKPAVGDNAFHLLRDENYSAVGGARRRRRRRRKSIKRVVFVGSGGREVILNSAAALRAGGGPTSVGHCQFLMKTLYRGRLNPFIGLTYKGVRDKTAPGRAGYWAGAGAGLNVNRRRDEINTKYRQFRAGRTLDIRRARKGFTRDVSPIHFLRYPFSIRLKFLSLAAYT